MPQFKFCFHLESKMSAAAAAAAAAPPASFPAMIRTISTLHEVETKTHPLFLSLCLYLGYPLDDMGFLFPFPDKSLFTLFLFPSFIMPSYDFHLRWFALCERSVCLRIFPPIEC